MGVTKLLIDDHGARAQFDNGAAPDHHATGRHLAVKAAMFFERHRAVAAIAQTGRVEPQGVAHEKCLIRRATKKIRHIEMAHIIAFPLLGDALITGHELGEKIGLAGHVGRCA